MSSTDRIHKLEGPRNYHTWIIEITALLQANGCSKIANGETYAWLEESVTVTDVVGDVPVKTEKKRKDTISVDTYLKLEQLERVSHASGTNQKYETVRDVGNFKETLCWQKGLPQGWTPRTPQYAIR